MLSSDIRSRTSIIHEAKFACRGKHFFPDTAANSLVPRYLRALTIANPHLSLIKSNVVLYDSHHDPSTVSIISGGGSGHEPGWSGYVGSGGLAGAACGDIFASPSTKQVLAAIRATPSEQGHILMITNYTGDKFHFGPASERAKADGLSNQVAMIHLADDVSIGRSKCGAVGRRGMPGHIIPMKIASAAARRKDSFERCVELARSVNGQVVSIGSALDHCHVPGRQEDEPIPDNIAIVGAGIHNEPGARRVSPFPSVEDLIGECLSHLCDPNDKERHFVTFEADDSVVLVMNNYGGMLNLEIGALTDEVNCRPIAGNWKIKPVRILSGAFKTSLDAPGFSISLYNVSAASRECKASVEELLELLEAPNTAVSWPNVITHKARNESIQAVQSKISIAKKSIAGSDIIVYLNLLQAVVRAGCDAAIASEPNLTKWDTVLGDGDCGTSVKGVSEAILKILDDGGADTGSVINFLHHTSDAIDDMGGTLGAILGILLSAFTSALKDSSTTDKSPNNFELFASALQQAVASLKTLTGAREGDRTVMDTLIPFADDFARHKELHHAVQVAHEKAEATRYLKARFGRATYVAEGQGQEVPDPGAWAFYVWVNGIAGAIKNTNF